ncbi:uncharacterized protein B0I36DRAFT_270444 [Microdochium trichocladiopsis]|uniref:FAD-binding domain-containing protein n=1 Tax=Microdochium trichocladiopsis TaxID=1682393 RepID=A0A9P8Y5K4_9PEZI|nr:uncharacterized protein B0I36DRAFT_270444 [Microdochium trichocladiopsis]KAH7029779.1 hypothetical protein B0I36DRAFT_270444 [Microdochium trichocladiopsis]
MASFRVIIVGGGLAGALLANGLLNNGVEVDIYERDTADSKREGYQIRLGAAADTGFDVCLQDDVKRAIHEKFGQSAGTGSTAPTVSNSRLDTLLDLTKFPNYSKSSAINRVVLRDILLGPIKAAGRVHYDKAFSKYTIIQGSQGLEKVRVHFADGSVETCDILVGADGSRSRVNHQLGARNLVDVNSHVSFVNKGSLTQDIISALPARLQAGPLLVFTKDITLFYALYLPSADGGAAAAAKLSKMQVDLNQGSFYWGMTVKKDRLGGKKIEDNLKFCLEQVKDWNPAYTDMIRIGAEQNDSIVAIPLRASNAVSKKWRQNAKKTARADATTGHERVWIMGDAIHAMQPNRGMGGNQAMQDAGEMLPELLHLADLSRSGKGPTSAEITAALTRFEDEMIDRAFTWVKKSGGTSVPSLDLDGPLGTLLKFVGMLVSVYSVFHRAVWSGASSKAKLA